MVYPISKRILMPLIKLLLIRKIEGLENIPKSRFIIAANHESYIDAIAISAAVVPHIYKKISFPTTRRGFFGLLLNHYLVEKLIGCIPVNGAVEKLIELLKKGEIVFIFPEGVVNPAKKLARAHKGVALIAIKAKAPVVPVGIKNSYEIWSKKQIMPLPKKIIEIKIGKPIYLREYYNKKLIAKTLNAATVKIMKEIGKIVGKRYSNK